MTAAADCLSQAELLARGWTAAEIDRHLGAADERLVNLRSRRQVLALYQRARVEAAERSPALLADREVLAGAERADEYRRAEAIMGDWQPTIEVLTADELLRRAVAWGATHTSRRKMHPGHLRRQRVFYAREHLVTNIGELASRLGVDVEAARALARVRILRAIGEVYGGEIAAECRNQIDLALRRS